MGSMIPVLEIKEVTGTINCTLSELSKQIILQIKAVIITVDRFLVNVNRIIDPMNTAQSAKQQEQK